MTIQTDAAIQAQIDASTVPAAGTGGGQNSVRIMRRVRASSTVESIYVVAEVPRAGRARWVDVNVASSASAQATDILATVGT